MLLPRPSLTAVKAVQMLTLLIVGVTLALPGLRTDEDEARTILEVEWRNPATLPPWPSTRSGWQAYPKALEAYLKDHHGFRARAIRRNSIVRLALGESSSEKVAIGSGGWFYYEGDKHFLDLDRGVPAEPEILSDRADAWARWARWISARGARFVFAPVPTKSTIYPEHLPDSVHRVGKANRTDQLLERLATIPELRLLDLRGPLRERAARERRPLYYKTDSHYNSLGAFHTFDVLLQDILAMEPSAVEAASPQMTITRGSLKTTDLARLLHLGDELKERDQKVSLVNVGKHTVTTSVGREGRTYKNCVANISRAGMRVLLFHDSFGVSLERFFCATFPEVLLVHHGFTGPSKEAVEDFAPDLVIVEWAEYSLLMPIERP